LNPEHTTRRGGERKGRRREGRGREGEGEEGRERRECPPPTATPGSALEFVVVIALKTYAFEFRCNKRNITATIRRSR